MTVAHELWTPPIASGEAVSEDRGLSISVTDDVSAALPFWLDLEASAVGSPFQRHGFVSAFLAHTAPAKPARPLIVVGRGQGGGFVLPLLILQNGPFRVARFAGGSHTNFNVGLFAPETWARLSPADVEAVFRVIDTAQAGVDLIDLRGQPRRLAGRENPFVDARSRPAPHCGWDLSLEGGMDAVLERHRGARKRKNLKAKTKGLSALGAVTWRRAETLSEAGHILDTFFEQKARRFAQQGLPDVFAAPSVRALFRSAIRSSGPAGPLLSCSALDVGGTIRATMISASFGGTEFLLMNSFALDASAKWSPAEVALFHQIEDCCNRGIERVDFGVGDARYKRSWADAEVALTDTLVPLTAKGTLAATMLKWQRSGVDIVRMSPALSAFAQRIRRRAHGDASDGDED
jgi:CelD/BcsL family acetyltransferase involved in cellulose biosynthesis